MTQVLAPDIYNAYSLVAVGVDGLVIFTYELLHLPEKATHIIFEWLPSTGAVYFRGDLVELGETVIDLNGIILGELVWDTEAPNTTALLDIGYRAYDSDDVPISLLQVYYPSDIVIDIVDNVVNGGNFKTNEAGAGYDTDAGDFDTGETVVNGYSYDGGDFDIGERVGVAPPPASGATLYKDGELNPVVQNGFLLLDENLDPVETSTLPNVQYFGKTVTLPDFSLSINYTLEHQIKYVTKYFEGFDYGSVVPNFGYDIDYGSVDSSNQEDYDFNAIVDYNEPTQSSGVS